MATITVRNLDDDVKRRLRMRAAENGRSMEAEAREILRVALLDEPPRRGFGTRAVELFAEYGGFELELPPRSEDAITNRRVPDFSGPGWDHLDRP
ncbi:plasmid stabilization protein [Conexibacter stalactiti]|uniref:Plasmid stabilization protein n=1 Tax=Conexibacter stalactiti TaxID=1940611 RepID=A0ABU4HTK6_9ACTN|nr:plasmid stabilization protein [Conexibacter stalactiti]MDW5596656.1 plasmid stabilization protein [Conexibacter stalactiti]MEC5037298.1 plasmid stabilization protein [Conexibacter stalactiti]